jgi:hypothetical protein
MLRITTLSGSALAVFMLLSPMASADIAPEYPEGEWPAAHCTVFDMSATPEYVLLVSEYWKSYGPEGGSGNSDTYTLYDSSCVPTKDGVAAMKADEWKTLSKGSNKYKFTKNPGSLSASYPKVLVKDADTASKAIKHKYASSTNEDGFLIFKKK